MRPSASKPAAAIATTFATATVSATAATVATLGATRATATVRRQPHHGHAYRRVCSCGCKQCVFMQRGPRSCAGRQSARRKLQGQLWLLPSSAKPAPESASAQPAARVAPATGSTARATRAVRGYRSYFWRRM